MFYPLGGDFRDFTINADTGRINSTRDLDYNIDPVHYIEVTANNYRTVNGQRIVIENRSPVGRANVYIHVLPALSTGPLIKDNLNLCKFQLSTFG